MRCPHCDYEDQISGAPAGFAQGEEGDFFVVGDATREHPVHPSMVERVKVYGCPSCYKTFINNGYY